MRFSVSEPITCIQQGITPVCTGCLWMCMSPETSRNSSPCSIHLIADEMARLVGQNHELESFIEAMFDSDRPVVYLESAVRIAAPHRLSHIHQLMILR